MEANTLYLPVIAKRPFASSNTFRTSFIPDPVADSSLNTAPDLFASKRARVVFPQPGGPQKTILPIFLPDSSRCLKREFGPVR